MHGQLTAKITFQAGNCPVIKAWSLVRVLEALRLRMLYLQTSVKMYIEQ